MKKLFIILILLITVPQVFASQWRNETGESTIPGTTLVSDIDAVSFEDMTDPLDRMLSNLKDGMELVYNSGTTIDVTAGEIMVENSDGSIRLMMNNTSSTSVTFSDLDTGAEASSTTYYVYAVAASSSAETATFKISANSSTPSGETFWARLGQFVNDSNSNISDIDNDRVHDYGTYVTKSFGVTYQALTDGHVMANTGSTGSDSLSMVSDSASSPTTTIIACNALDSGERCAVSAPVKKGDYYKITATGGERMFFISTED